MVESPDRKDTFDVEDTLIEVSFGYWIFNRSGQGIWFNSYAGAQTSLSISLTAWHVRLNIPYYRTYGWTSSILVTPLHSSVRSTGWHTHMYVCREREDFDSTVAPHAVTIVEEQKGGNSNHKANFVPTIHSASVAMTPPACPRYVSSPGGN